jgi:DeoR/GlpR family transcriptional regulator of sugar metabolism
MYKAERKNDIIALLREQGFSSTQRLAQQLAVSQTTIYRYLTELEQEGLIRKAYGGVSLEQRAPQSVDYDYRWRKQEHQQEKHDLAVRAAALVESGDTVFVDSSTTSVIFAQELARLELEDVTLITNSARIVLALRNNQEFRVICTGGTYLARHDTLVGSPAEEFVATLTANKCFISASGVTPQGATDSDPADVRVKRMMLARAQTKILMADHSKFGRSTTFTVATPAELNLIVTDAVTPLGVLAPFVTMGLQVLAPDVVAA